MPLNITCILVIIAFIICILSAIGRAPLWVSVLLIAIAMMLGCLPR